MFLKFISIPDFDFQTSYKNGIYKIKSLSLFDKIFTIFWLLGPFVFLIERDPADFWLSFIGLVFLIRSFIVKDWSWANQTWFKLALILWLISLISALANNNTLFSLKEGFVWIRFPIYAVAAQAWLARDKDIRTVMLSSMFFGVIIMCIILILELIIDPKPRLEWPYNDTMTGAYLTKVSLPLFCVMCAIAGSRINFTSIFYGLTSILTIAMSFLTGERVSFVIKIFSGFLSGLNWKPKLFPYIFFTFILMFCLSSIMILRPDLGTRYTKTFFNNIPMINTHDNNPYWGSWRSGIQQITITPILGIGPSGSRKTCLELPPKEPAWLPGKNYCGNHPHNFYIQLFSETGIFGLMIGTLMFISIIKSCYKVKLDNPTCPISATAFIIPLSLFFPLQQFGSFFGQWGNLFIWFAVGFAISQVKLRTKD